MQRHPQMQGRNLAGRQDISEDPETSNLRAATFQLVAYHKKIFEILTVS